MEVLPCPFCQNNRIELIELNDQPGDAFAMICSDCGGRGPDARDQESAMNGWNDRTWKE